MGVPKFFRWLSERYPAISQLIADNRIPEFDCLYLDMNGIIHNCTHKDSADDVSFRLTEEEMFIRIFNYIEHLFSRIKPKQLFFMAIDGVAPRAKMNQQRARRFRTALEAEKAREKAISEGVELPKEPPFDSNCITPGTEFMAKLSMQLRYFVNKKVSEDTDWQRCEIVLSGHEVPGEGEHKIMEYIRDAKAQPDYDHNVRHCLYGLDADLIMLGLLSHDPHFCLLREEVTFGRASQSKSKELEHQNFYLLHLCIVREYLELEFQQLKEDGVLSFPFDLERVIDDFILMAFFVGNDFLPHLPSLHINEGALAKMFKLYKRVLPTTDGYINEEGVINLKRLALLLDGLADEEASEFEDSVANEGWFQSKKMEEQLKSDKGNGAAQPKTANGKLVITTEQKDLWKLKLRPFVNKRSGNTLNLGAGLNAANRKFVQDLADAFHLVWATKERDDGHRDLVVSFPPRRARGHDADDDDDNIDDDDDEEEEVEEEEEEEEEGSLAAIRIQKKYDTAIVVNLTAEDAQEKYKKLYQDKKFAWKTKYYLDKFPEWQSDKFEAEMVKLCENYVQGLQWVLFYYYRGIASWPWFYAYHYSPMISDVCKGLGADLNFKKGQPFRPYEQLMGVLPDRSKSIVPSVYWDLMTNPKSPIIDFYPRNFELDMNGKKMDWEAVVKIPFIDENRLLAAMEPANALLSEEEAARNGFGVAIKFTYSPTQAFDYPSSLPGIFPNLIGCHCIENIFDLPPTDGLEYRVGLMEGAKLKMEALAGFPTLHTLPHSASLIEGYGVNVFQQDSRNPSMVVNLSGANARTKAEANKLKLGKCCFVGYPFLQEAKIVKVSDELFDYTLDANGHVVMKEHSNQESNDFSKEAHYIENWHAKRLGITIDTVESLVTVEMLKGLVKTEEGALVKEYGPNPSLRSVYAAQTVVDEVVNEDERFVERAAVPVAEEFPVGTRAFFMADYAYGRPVEVMGHSGNKLHIAVSKLTQNEPEFAKAIIIKAKSQNPFMPSFAVARELRLHPLLLSKITSSFHINTIGGLRVNLGLNLKFDGKKLKVLGYSQKSASGWEFSQKAIQLLASYMKTFPVFFAVLSSIPQKSEINDTDIWPEQATAQAQVKEIVSWLKAQDTNKFEKVPLDAEQLDSNTVMALAQEGEKVAMTMSAVSSRKLRDVPRSAIFKPADAEVVLCNQKFEVGDRVTYAAGNGKVPIATRGTVVGLTHTATALLLDVVWDIGIMSGNTLGGRAPSFRGQTVSSACVINLTNRQVLSSSRAAMLRAVPVATSLTTSAYGSVGVPRYEATMPKPLRGGWAKAVSGSPSNMARGGRGGRGGSRPNGPGGPSILHPVDLAHRPAPSNIIGQNNGLKGARGGWVPRGSRGSNHGGPSQSPRRGEGASHNPHLTVESGIFGAVPPPPKLNNQAGRGHQNGRGGGGARRGEIRGRGDSSRGRGRGGRGAVNSAPDSMPRLVAAPAEQD